MGVTYHGKDDQGGEEAHDDIAEQLHQLVPARKTRPPREQHLPHWGWEGTPLTARVTEGDSALWPAPLSLDFIQLHPASAGRARWPWAGPCPSLRLGFHTCELTKAGWA